MTFSDAVAVARDDKKRGVILRSKNNLTRVLLAFDRLWCTGPQFDCLVPFCPTEAQATNDNWEASDAV